MDLAPQVAAIRRNHSDPHTASHVSIIPAGSGLRRSMMRDPAECNAASVCTQ
jgi:hypothetical protein